VASAAHLKPLSDYQVRAPGLERLALIVRAADVKGQEHVAAEGIGLRAIAQGTAALGVSDEERLARGFSCGASKHRN